MANDEPTPAGPARAAGRPRAQEKDQAILDATRMLLATEGYAAVTIEGVAARARVARTTIYRRWRSKLHLVIAAVEGPVVAVPIADTGSLRTDLFEVERETGRMFAGPEFRMAAPGLVADLAGFPDLAAAYRRDVIERRREAIRTVLRRGIERGELRPGADLDLLMDQLTGPLWYRAAVRGAAISAAETDQIVETVLAGYGTGERLPQPREGRRRRVGSGHIESTLPAT